MKTLKDFLEKSKSSSNLSIALPSANALARVITKEIISSPVQLSNTDASKFSEKVSELATSSEVIDKLSAEVGSPKPHESEDEFVERAKLALARILKSKLTK